MPRARSSIAAILVLVALAPARAEDDDAGPVLRPPAPEAWLGWQLERWATSPTLDRGELALRLWA